MRILKKIWSWLSTDVTKGFQKSDEDFMLKDGATGYNSGGYIKDNVNYVAPEEFYKARKLKEGDALSKEVQGTKKEIPRYAIRGYIKNAERYVAPRYSEIISSNNNTYRNNNDNFLTGAMVGYVIADYLNDDNSHKAVEETKSSSYESSYTPSSSSSYDSGSYSSSSDSGSSSSYSCDSGC